VIAFAVVTGGGISGLHSCGLSLAGCSRAGVTGEAGSTTGVITIGLPLEGRRQAGCMPGVMYIDLAAASCDKTSISNPFSNAKRLRVGAIMATSPLAGGKV